MFLLQTRNSYSVHYKSWRHILDSPASGYPGAYKLINIHHSVTFVKIFLDRLISEVSRYNICKFDQIASNSLQIIKIVQNFLTVPRIWIFKTLACTVLDERTDTWIDGCTHNPKPICPVNYFKVGGITLNHELLATVTYPYFELCHANL